MSTTLTTRELAHWAGSLASLDTDIDDRERIEQLSLLETLKCAAAAAQARVAAAFDASQRRAQRASGVPTAKVGAGVGEQVALARRESPARGSRLLGLGKALVHEMPHTLEALERGDLNEWRATLLVQATAVLDVEGRAAVDARLAGCLGGLSDKHVQAAARAIAYQLSPQAVVDAHAYAVTQRRVSIRPAPDAMASLHALLPAPEAVAVYRALHDAAGTARAAGDPRSADQVKADTLVARVTGKRDAGRIPVEIGLVMTDATLLAGDPTPAHLTGYGPIPATLARTLATGTPTGTSPTDTQTDTQAVGGTPVANESEAGKSGAGKSGAEKDKTGCHDPAGIAASAAVGGEGEAARRWVRRLYLDPAGVITRADTTRRRFPEHLRRLVIARDQWCRTPWCGAPIHHIDHAQAYAAGGLTVLDNAQGLCERCNHAKEAPGWHTTVQTGPLAQTPYESGVRTSLSTDAGHPVADGLSDGSGSAGDVVPVITTTTPTGHAYSTRARPWHPGLIGPRPRTASDARDVGDGSQQIPTSADPDVTSDLTANLMVDVASAVTSDLTAGATSDANSAVTSAVTSDLTAGVSSDVTADLTANLTSDASSALTAGENSDVTSDENSDVTSDENSDVTSDLTPIGTLEPRAVDTRAPSHVCAAERPPGQGSAA